MINAKIIYEIKTGKSKTFVDFKEKISLLILDMYKKYIKKKFTWTK